MLKFIFTLISFVFKPKREYIIFIDRIKSADDNAEHLYRYVSQTEYMNNKIFFILSEKSPDWNRLKDEGFNLLSPNKIETYLRIAKCKTWICSDLEKVCQFNPKKK